MIHDSYVAARLVPARLRGAELLIAAIPGLPEGASVAPAVTLCAELITPDPQERVLLMGCGNGALAAALARLLPDGAILLTDSSLIALRAAAATLRANTLANATVSPELSLLPHEAGRFDRVVILAPQSRDLGRRWMVEAHGLLRPGGILTLAGANDQGIRALIGDADALFGATHLLGYGGGCRVAETSRQASPDIPPPWAALPGIAPDTWERLQVGLGPGGRYGRSAPRPNAGQPTADFDRLSRRPPGLSEPTTWPEPAEGHTPDLTLDLRSLPGIFSHDRLDPGTALLLDQLGDLRGARVLDVGCGYGVIGIVAALRGAAAVTMIDVNLLAVAAATTNAARYAPGATVAAADGLELGGGPYDLIASNPPFHAGRRIDTAMAAALIRRARAHLAPGGRLLLVANRFLPYDRLLAEQFPSVTVRADNRQYWVLEAHNDRVTR